MGWFGPFTYKLKKKDGKKEKWWLHSKQKGKTTIYYFSRDPKDALQDKPNEYDVIINERAGIPLLKKKSWAKKAKE